MFFDWLKNRPFNGLQAMTAAAMIGVMIAGAAQAQDAVTKEEEELAANSVTHQMYLDMKLGKLNIHGDNAVVEALVLQRDIPVSYDYIATLMRTPNAFGDGPACIVCHGSNDPAKSYRGMERV